jgi:hypothetical protein
LGLYEFLLRAENSNYGKCAQEICLTVGVHPIELCPRSAQPERFSRIYRF